MLMIRPLGRLLASLAFVAVSAASLAAQGITTSAMSGTIITESGPVVSARVTAVHTPSGTTYLSQTRMDGRFIIPGMRVGGPYSVTAVAVGFERVTRSNVYLTLGQTADVSMQMNRTAVQLSEIAVTANAGESNATRTGASTTISNEALAAFPTIGRTITDFTRLTPQSSGSSFAGQDNRLNNISLDGSYFNNAFGLGSQPGARTGVSPIPIDAIEQIEVNIAPFDVRQGNFTGAGVNAVTKSGTNDFKGSAYYTARNQDYVGTKVAGLTFNPGVFKFGQIGGYASGPLIRNKLFFFLNYETDDLTQPGTNFTANTGGQSIEGNTTRVLASDLDQLSTFLQTRFNYATGPYQGFDLVVPSSRYIAKLDWNVNTRNKFSFRYSQLNSQSDQPVSNSGSLGNNSGNRRDNANSMSFLNSGYAILENSKSYVAELNTQLGSRMSNQIIAGYTENDESRKSKGTIFPLVDILDNGLNYISFGFEPFTPSNVLKYKTLQFQDNFSLYLDKHNLTFGVTAQKYNSDNGFAPGLQSAYVYNSLADFYADANDQLANPARTQSPVTLNRFQVRYSNIPGLATPLQPLEVFTYGAYLQDEWRVRDNFVLTGGLRFDLPVFTNTAFNNPLANQLSFRNENNETVRLNTGELPKANVLFSPRVGFNWDVARDRSTVVRGGTGVFSGTPPLVWISNQLGNTGVLTGFDQVTNTRTRPFNPDPDRYKPTTVTGAPAATYELNVSDPGYKFSQVWRSNLAIDQQLPFGFVGTLEGLYGTEVNGAYYVNANLPAAQTKFTGADTRQRWTSNRINSNINAAYVLSNTNSGRSFNVAASLTREFRNGLFAKSAYSYGVSKNAIDPGSTAAGNWLGNAQANDPNNPGVGFSAFSPGHRIFLALSYRREYFSFGATSVSLFTQGQTQNNVSYLFSADANGDNATNDLLYVPRNISEMNFEQYCVNAGGAPQTNCANAARTFTVAEQQTAWDAYITQDEYLSKRRGQYTERNAVFLPINFRSDLGVTQEIFTNVGAKRNTVSLRFDILNLDNLLNSKWGAGNRVVSNQPLVPRGADANGALQYRLRNIGTGLLPAQTFQRTSGQNDVWRMQLGVRYTFN
ncbi:MAG TPA: carboxypeptidase regulatory-like domain-containing protein [Gemmatimonas sp.]|nr:carboxypeptidase regulatory-like domain-containing protein [Gemmatimonas sp.]